MSCYHPMVLIETSNMCDPEQRKIVEKLKLIHKQQKSIRSCNTILIPRELAIDEGIDLRLNKALLVPCGRCIGCRLDYSREWAIRCMKEVEQYQDNWFLTLDYDDEHLPVGKKGVPSLRPSDVSSFMKRLRTRLQREIGHVGVRFFACGEYGDASLRPHLHIILINCPLPDLQERHPIPVDGVVKWIRQYDTNGEKLLYSPLIGECWTYGRSPLGKVTFESCAYVSRYIVKKQYGEGAEQYQECGVEAPFVRMSRNPGIGHQWFMENLDRIYEFDNFNIKRGDKVINIKPGKYCDKLLKLQDEQLYYDIKKKRHEDFYDGVDCLSYENIDVVINNHKAEASKKVSIKTLKRNL